MLHRRFPSWREAPGKVERRQRRGASGAPIVEKRTERGQGALLGLDSGFRPKLVAITILVTVTNDHGCSRSIKSARFLSQRPGKHDKNRIYPRCSTRSGNYMGDNATG
jgi:hypothetical protein